MTRLFPTGVRRPDEAPTMPRPLSSLLRAAALAGGALLAVPGAALAHSSGATPAGGAAIEEAAIATAGAAVVLGAMAMLFVAHRKGKTGILRRLSALSERTSALPGWCALPIFVLVQSLLVAAFGMYWDISLHIDDGRDPGPLANPAHYFILVGLFGVLFAGLLSIVLAEGGRPSRSAVKLRGELYAPLGGLLVAACGAIALAGFPLDDIWHRIFGQDVTLWGPTHLQLFGAASLSTIGGLILFGEGIDARRAEGARRPVTLKRIRQAVLAGALLIGLSTFQAEYDFAVPQFRLVLHPILIMLAAGTALVAARIRIGRGGALMAVAVYLGVRGLFSLFVGPVFGQTPLHFPLYVVEAIVVELVALRVSDRRPIALGAAAGAAIGTIGLAAEWGWSHVWMTLSWPASLLPEAAIAGLLAAVAGGLLGAGIGAALNRERRMAGRQRALAMAAAGATVVGLAIYAVPIDEGNRATADVTLREVVPPPEREVQMTVRLDPPDAAEGARWFNATAWQGQEPSVVDELERVAPGVYRTTRPIPVHGNWKTTIRLHRGSAVQSVPVFMPRDEGIPVDEIPAKPRFTREFELDKHNLQREQKQGVAGWLTTVAYLAILVIAVVLIGLLVWALRRFDRTASGEPAPAGDGAARTPTGAAA